MDRQRTLLLAGGLVATLAVGAVVYWQVLALGCGLGNASVYPLVETNETVESPVVARETVVTLIEANTTTPIGPITRHTGNASEFNREYVRMPERKTEAFTDGIRQRGAPLEDGETYYFFASEYDGGVGVTEQGEVFYFEPGIC